MVSFNELAGIAIVFVIVTIVLGIGADIVSTIQDDQTTDDYAYNVSEEGLESLQTLSEWLPTIALVIAAVVVISVVGYFRMVK